MLAQILSLPPPAAKARFQRTVLQFPIFIPPNYDILDEYRLTSLCDVSSHL